MITNWSPLISTVIIPRIINIFHRDRNLSRFEDKKIP